MFSHNTSIFTIPIITMMTIHQFIIIIIMVIMVIEMMVIIIIDQNFNLKEFEYC